MSSTFATSESVCAGHPDKICDQISDAIVDAALAADSASRVAVETLVTANRVVLAGEVTSLAKLNYRQLVREQLRRLGYTDPRYHFGPESPISVYIHQQSPEIAQGVDQDGAGDQGMMYGYATAETPEQMPLPIVLAHQLAAGLDQLRESQRLGYLRPDGKTQVTVRYQAGQPVAVERVVLAVPHAEEVELEQVHHELLTVLVQPTLAAAGFELEPHNLTVNGTGVWHIGGPVADTGVTGRKIVVDTYGGLARVGGGAFSGKDPTKVDRSAAYAARYLAKLAVAAGLATRVEVGLAYCIGQRQPVMTAVESFGTARVSPAALQDFVVRALDTSVAGIIEHFQLRRPLYLSTAAYGHFGRPQFPWEQLPA